MRLVLARILLRLTGTLIGLLGLGLLVLGVLMLSEMAAGGSPWVIGLLIPGLALGVYGVYIAYLAWGEVTPKAVRGVFRILALFAALKASDLVERLEPSLQTQLPWSPFAFLGCLFVVYLVYRFVTDRVIAWLFPELSSSTPPRPHQS